MYDMLTVYAAYLGIIAGLGAHSGYQLAFKKQRQMLRGGMLLGVMPLLQMLACKVSTICTEDVVLGLYAICGKMLEPWNYLHMRRL